MSTHEIFSSFTDWRRAVSERLQSIYCVTIDDVGFDDDLLANYWASHERPDSLVEWIGNKYDLDHKI